MVSDHLQVGMIGKRHLLRYQLVVGLQSVIIEIILRVNQRYQRVTILLEHLVGKGNLSVDHLVHLIHQLFLLRPFLSVTHLRHLFYEGFARFLTLQLKHCQTLVQRRALQRAVVQVDNNRRTIIEETRHPHIILQLHCHQSVFLGRTVKGKLGIGNRHAVYHLVRQIVVQIHHLSFVSVCTANGITHLLGHSAYTHSDHR